jgi:hypothetical protein
LARSLNVDDEAWILLKGKEARESGSPVYLETREMPGWTGPLPRYLLWCLDCSKFTVTHPHGYTERLECHRCRRVYKRLKPPPRPEMPKGLARLVILRLLVLLATATAAIMLFRSC